MPASPPAPRARAPDREMVRLLVSLGIREPEARVLACLARHGPARSRDLEDACGLRQPQVSAAVRQMANLGWVRSEPQRANGRGRPVNHHAMARPLDDLLDEFAAKARAREEAALRKVARLRELLV